MISVSLVDRHARGQVAVLLKKVVLGRVGKDECESTFLDLLDSTTDPVVFAVFRTIAELGGDDQQSLSQVFAKRSDMRKRVCRWILFLKTEYDYQWPKERLAPGIRDLYKAPWYDKLFGFDIRMIGSNRSFCEHGDYWVWPFLHEADFDAARGQGGTGTPMRSEVKTDSSRPVKRGKKVLLASQDSPGNGGRR